MAGTDNTNNTDQVTLGSTVVAVAILAIIGLVLAIAAVRYDEGDLAKVVGALGPLLGVVTGAFVTYFFNRSAVQASAATATAATARSQDLHNALTTVVAGLSPSDGAQAMATPAVAKALAG